MESRAEEVMQQMMLSSFSFPSPRVHRPVVSSHLGEHLSGWLLFCFFSNIRVAD